MDATVAANIDALEQTWCSLGDVLEDLGADQWSLPTGCPGWSVQDNVSHIIGLEHHIIGDPPPDHELPGLDHIRDDVGRFMEVPVDFRRGWPPDKVLTEYREITADRLVALREDSIPADMVLPTPFGGELPYRQLLALRVFDCYAHEQDVRRATDHRGNLTGPAAVIGRRQLVMAWGELVRRTPALDGVKVVLEIDGEDNSLSTEVGDPHPALTELRLRTSFENALALGCGRTDGASDQVVVIGNESLFKALIPSLGFTP